MVRFTTISEFDAHVGNTSYPRLLIISARARMEDVEECNEGGAEASSYSQTVRTKPWRSRKSADLRSLCRKISVYSAQKVRSGTRRSTYSATTGVGLSYTQNCTRDEQELPDSEQTHREHHIHPRKRIRHVLVRNFEPWRNQSKNTDKEHTEGSNQKAAT